MRFGGIMDKIEIKHRITDVVLWSGETATVRDAIVAVVKAGADLTGAYLAGAYLADANLADADLADANLARAYLTGAYLTGADLAGAYLAGADLADADLAGADLTGAYLAGANLAGADLAGADLAGAGLAGADLAGAGLAGADLADANLAGAYLADADLAGADLADANLAGAYLADARNKPASLADHKDPEPPFVRRVPSADAPPLSREERATRRLARQSERAARYRVEHPSVPVVQHLDARIERGIDTGAIALDMGNWHGLGPSGVEATPEACGTTHCRAGSAVYLAGEAGYALERELGSAEEAGRAIYLASTGRVPYFYSSNDRALADIRRCAEADPLPRLQTSRSSF
jgi:hypothetical protein